MTLFNQSNRTGLELWVLNIICKVKITKVIWKAEFKDEGNISEGVDSEKH